MNVGDIKEYKLVIGQKEYSFRLDFKALIKFNKTFDNALEIFNDFLNGKNEYDCIIKILSCACIEKDFTEKELLESISFDFPTMKTLDLISLNLITGSIDIDGKSNGEHPKNM